MNRLYSTFAALLLAVTASAADPKPNYARLLGSSIADAVEKVMPSVVVIRTEAVRYRMARDVFYGRVFGIPERLAGQGSGLFISKDGYILTNNHVVDNAEEIEVALNDGTVYPAEVIGVDPHTDVAVLKVKNARGRVFDPLEAGDSDKLRVGEFVIAIGSPFSLASSVTVGIVSQKGRSIGALPYEDFIQSDAAINQGNSGGPLVDVDGRVVGINTMIQTAGYSEGNIGISFAIPANLAMHVAESIIKKGNWERPWVGVSMSSTERGVVVDEVIPSSPAAAGGLREGDRLISIDGINIGEPRDLQRRVLSVETGGTVKVRIERAGKQRDVELVTARMPLPGGRARR